MVLTGGLGTVQKNQIVRSRLHPAAAASILIALACALTPARVFADTRADEAKKLFLHSGWALQSSCQ
jgi:hypothetical protein